MKLSPPTTTNWRRKPAISQIAALSSSFVLGFLAAFTSFSTSDRTRSLRNEGVSQVKHASESVSAALQSREEDGWKTIDVFYGTRDHLPIVSSVAEANFRQAEEVLLPSQATRDCFEIVPREARGGSSSISLPTTPFDSRIRMRSRQTLDGLGYALSPTLCTGLPYRTGDAMLLEQLQGAIAKKLIFFQQRHGWCTWWDRWGSI